MTELLYEIAALNKQIQAEVSQSNGQLTASLLKLLSDLDWTVHGWELPPAYDKAFGDDRLCHCGHAYYRHFDTYEGMRPVGCKYCGCRQWKDPAGLCDEDGTYWS